MSEWWTYTLQDFLLFSKETYYRLFELYNASVWPGHLLALAAGGALLALTIRPRPQARRVVYLLLAAAWGWVAWGYFHTHYATINWIAPHFAVGFAVQGVVLVLAGLFDRQKPRAAGATARIGLGLVVFALLIQPLIGPLVGRAWSQVEVFGIAPDPTVTATLGFILAADRIRWSLLVLPVLWCLLSGLTLWTMGTPDFWILPGIALLTLAAAAWEQVRGRRRVNVPMSHP